MSFKAVIDQATAFTHERRIQLVRCLAPTAKTFDELLEQIESRINSGRLEVDLVVPYDKYEAMNVIRAEGRILKEDHQGDGAHLKIQINETALWKLKRMLGEGYGQN